MELTGGCSHSGMGGLVDDGGEVRGGHQDGLDLLVGLPSGLLQLLQRQDWPRLRPLPVVTKGTVGSWRPMLKRLG